MAPGNFTTPGRVLGTGLVEGVELVPKRFTINDFGDSDDNLEEVEDVEFEDPDSIEDHEAQMDDNRSEASSTSGEAVQTSLVSAISNQIR